MVSKSEIKFLNSLNLLKFRNKHNLFKVEGWRSIKEFLSSDYKLINLFVSKDFLKNSNLLDSFSYKVVNQSILNKISSLKSPSQTLAIFEKKTSSYNLLSLKKKLVIALEDISNPGNLGSIIRTADWFGIKHIFCSHNSVDLYNPKVIQSTMGSLSRVNVVYLDLSKLIDNLKKEKFKLFAADLNGSNFYNQKINNGIIFFGNESAGLSKKLSSKIINKIKVPSKNSQCDSLNLSVSFGIIVSEIVR
tara:strand:- start:1095 stop:1835 length:741 start_codon:yes stop_codon:yes gene_type:complete